MMELIETLNFILALAGVALFLGAAVLLFDLFSKNKTLLPLVQRYGLLGAFLLTLGGSAMTLVYSDIFGFLPCGLCWLQRVFLYPQVFMLGLGVYLKDKMIAAYGILLCIPGVIISLYQHYLQMGGAELVTCPTVSSGANCADRFLFEFGFMTFPLMSTALFVFLIALYVYILKTKTAS